MRCSNETAHNLFSCVFSYPPRLEREPIEDFCTEVLAWSLRKSEAARANFLQLFKIAQVQTVDVPWAVSTQLSFRPTPEETEEEGDNQQTPPHGGRFDLVIETERDPKFVFVIESKIGSGFGADQLKRYRDELRNPESFPGVSASARFLITLTTFGEKEEHTDAALKWSDVQRMLGVVVDADKFVDTTIKNFVDFLAQRGLAPMKMPQINEESLMQWTNVKELEESLIRIVERLRIQEEIKEITGRRQVKRESEWIGVYGKNGFWAGFGVAEVKSRKELFIWVEISFDGDKRSLIGSLPPTLASSFAVATEYLKSLDDDSAANLGNVSGKNTRFVFVRQIDQELNGNADAVFKWLYDTSKQAIALQPATNASPDSM